MVQVFWWYIFIFILFSWKQNPIECEQQGSLDCSCRRIVQYPLYYFPSSQCWISVVMKCKTGNSQCKWRFSGYVLFYQFDDKYWNFAMILFLLLAVQYVSHIRMILSVWFSKEYFLQKWSVFCLIFPGFEHAYNGGSHIHSLLGTAIELQSSNISWGS